MFRATLCPSSGETTVFVWHLLLVILCGWLSGMLNNYPLYTKNKLCTKVALFTGLYKDARSTKHKFMTPYSSLILRFKLFFSSILKSLRSSETSGSIHANTLYRIPADRNSQILCRENFRFSMIQSSSFPACHSWSVWYFLVFVQTSCVKFPWML